MIEGSFVQAVAKLCIVGTVRLETPTLASRLAIVETVLCATSEFDLTSSNVLGSG